MSYMELTHLGSKASKYNYRSIQNKLRIWFLADFKMTEIIQGGWYFNVLGIHVIIEASKYKNPDISGKKYFPWTI